MPSWQDFQPFIVSGLALGGSYALSGVGIVVLYQATGVVYLAFGAVGAMGALIAWSLANAGVPGWAAWLVCVLFGGAVTLAYGMIFGPPLARRDPLVKAVATLGLTLVLFGVMDLLWTTNGGQSRAITCVQVTLIFPMVKPPLSVGRVSERACPPLVVQSRSIAPYRISVRPMVATALTSGSRLARAGPKMAP